MVFNISERRGLGPIGLPKGTSLNRWKVPAIGQIRAGCPREGGSNPPRPTQSGADRRANEPREYARNLREIPCCSPF